MSVHTGKKINNIPPLAVASWVWEGLLELPFLRYLGSVGRVVTVVALDLCSCCEVPCVSFAPVNNNSNC
jgi:hypothetical protein